MSSKGPGFAHNPDNKETGENPYWGETSDGPTRMRAPAVSQDSSDEFDNLAWSAYGAEYESGELDQTALNEIATRMRFDQARREGIAAAIRDFLQNIAKSFRMLVNGRRIEAQRNAQARERRAYQEYESKVRAHQRHLPGGKVVNVRAHMRGAPKPPSVSYRREARK